MTIANNEDNVSIPNGRERTDRSLNAERAKTDRSLAEAKERLERNADNAVLTSRGAADKTRTRIRIEGDNSKEKDRIAPGAERLDEQLQKERKVVDNTIDTERRQIDHVFESERLQKQTIEKEFLQLERTETNKNLRSERSWTDNEILRAANVLSEEMKAHLVTRTDLTSRKDLLAIVSHDLKNPLASISMAVEILKSAALDGAGKATMQKYIDLIGRNASEALRLIGDLLDMERMAAGKVTLQVEPYDFKEIIHYSFKTFEHQTTDKRLILEMNCPDEDVIVLCDRDRIFQVLSNLTSNALKFTPKEGKVTIAVSCCADEVQVSVSDTGPGIPRDMHEKIFERFWQFDKQNPKGLGLGLYISKMIVEAHHGRIWVDSSEGQGSTFHFTIPVDCKGQQKERFSQ